MMADAGLKMSTAALALTLVECWLLMLRQFLLGGCGHFNRA